MYSGGVCVTTRTHNTQETNCLLTCVLPKIRYNTNCNPKAAPHQNPHSVDCFISSQESMTALMVKCTVMRPTKLQHQCNLVAATAASTGHNRRIIDSINTLHLVHFCQLLVRLFSGFPKLRLYSVNFLEVGLKLLLHSVMR